MPPETKFLRLPAPVTMGYRLGDWRVCWLGGWTRNRLSYLVMVVRLVGEVENRRPANPRLLGKIARLRIEGASIDLISGASGVTDGHDRKPPAPGCVAGSGNRLQINRQKERDFHEQTQFNTITGSDCRLRICPEQ